VVVPTRNRHTFIVGWLVEYIRKQMVSEREKNFLLTMVLMERFSKVLGSISYIWGGLSIDIYKGRFLRSHSDIDYLVLDLQRLAQDFAELLFSEGWDVKAILNDHLLIAGKDNIKLHLGNIEIDDVVNWRHNGDNGTITFPVGWLREYPIDFYDVQVHVVEPEFSYVIKSLPSLMNPEWVSRGKDQTEIKILEGLLVQRDVESGLLTSLVNSF